MPERIPYAIAMELALTGDNLPAERAHELGLVNVLAEPGTALDAAIALAEKITANGPLAVVATKRIITESRGWSPDTMFAEQMKILVPVFTSNDAKEGAIAFAEAPAPLDGHLAQLRDGVAHRQQDTLLLGEVFDTLGPVLAADSGVLVAAEG